MHPTKEDLEQVEADLKSDDQPTRYAALHRLHLWTRLNSDCHGEALRFYRRVVAEPRDGATVNAALNGLEFLGCGEEAREARLRLLESPIESVVRYAVLGFGDARYAPMLLELLDRRRETDLRITLIRTLGRMKAASKLVLPSLVRLLPDTGLRPHIAEALGDLGDKGAIPHLEALLKDRAEAWPIDNHGPMLRVCDLAEEALGRLKGG